MIEYWPESKSGIRPNFEQFRGAVQAKCPDVRFALIGGNLLVVGTVPAYSLKAQIDAEAASREIDIQNCVRVVPGREWFAPEITRAAG
jgi:hypothetical protein